MSKKRVNLWRVVTIISIVGLFTILITTLPVFWFEKQLAKTWNIDGGDEVNQQRNRLCLIVALDGVPYGIIKELFSEGYFKGFFPPGRLVSTFPSLTRPAFSKMLVGGKPFGYERLYFNALENKTEGSQLTEKIFSTNEPPADYHPKLHFLGFPGYIAYVFPDIFAETTLSSFHERLLAFKGDRFIAYIGLSDPIAHVEGREALLEFLKKVSAILDTVRNDLGILLDVVLFSDHGNNLIASKRVELGPALEKGGFHDTDMLNTEKDFVLPRNGFVSFASIYTWPENAQPMAKILSKVRGVDFSIYREGDTIMVLGVGGLARVSKKNESYRYTQIDGDPLKLGNILEYLKRSASNINQGFIHEKLWWEATKDHLYPDPLRRIWESLNDLVQYPGTILVSFLDGYAFGPPIFNQPILGGRAGTHGALLGTQSHGVYMTDFMQVPAFNRPDDMVDTLARAEEAKRKGIKRFPFFQ